MIDPLSRVVEWLQPRAVAWRVIEAHAPWGLQFPASKVVIFGQVMQGSCTMDREDGVSLTLNAGDFLLMAAPPAWTLHTSGTWQAIDFTHAFDDPSILLRAHEDCEKTIFIAGRFSLALPHAEFLTRWTVPVVHVRAAEVARGRLGSLLGILGEEVLADRPGRSLVCDRLLEILLVEALRHAPSRAPAARPGLLAGLTDPHVGRALRLMHDNVGLAWTVEALARQASLSRSAFSARFSAVVGTAPMEYLISWRMTVAQHALLNSTLSLSRIADMIGYQSLSAFSLAFKNNVGCPPSAYRKRHRGAGRA